MDMEWDPLAAFFSAGLSYSSDNHPSSSSSRSPPQLHSTFSADRSAFESQDQAATAALNLDLEHPQDGIPNEPKYFGIWHHSASHPLPHELRIDAPTPPSESLQVTINPTLLGIRSPANLDPRLLALREEEEEEELLPEGEGSTNIAIMEMSVDSHSNQSSTTPAAPSTKRKHKASLDILPLNRSVSTRSQKQLKGKAKELPMAGSGSTLATRGILEWTGGHFFVCFSLVLT
jgi:hypothetical protein